MSWSAKTEAKVRPSPPYLRSRTAGIRHSPLRRFMGLRAPLTVARSTLSIAAEETQVEEFAWAANAPVEAAAWV